MPAIARRLVATLLVVVASTALPAQDAAPPTDDAFDALFSLPQNLPEGTAFPTSREPLATEAALREVLEDDLAAGADLNAMRHGGTLLHHALRADLQDTALWLLAHGADPRREVLEEGSAQAVGRDALQLAIVLRRWRVVDALLRRPAVAPKTPRDLAFRWTAVFDRRAEPGTIDDAARELGRRLAWPADWYGGCLLAAAQDAVVVPMLLKSTDRTPLRRDALQARTLQGRDREIAELCGPASVATGVPAHRRRDAAGRFWRFKPAELASADTRVAQPLLQLLAPLVDTPADAKAWAALPLRRPWQDAAFARPVVLAFLHAPTPETRDTGLRTIPPDALRLALDDDIVLHDWLAMLATLPPPRASAALAQIDDATLRRHVQAAVTGLAGVPASPGFSTDSGRVAAPAALWGALLDRLPAPLALQAGILPITFVPEDAWPALFAHGHRPSADELVVQWTFTTSGQWREQWPKLRAAAGPEVVTATIADIVLPWTHACADAGAAPGPDHVARLREMLASGAMPPAPVPLSLSCAQRADPEALRALLATRLVTAPPGAAGRSLTAVEVPSAIVPRGRFELAPLACSPVPDPAIVRAAIRDAFLVDEPPPGHQDDTTRPASLQPIDEPGAAGCAWLVTGGAGSSRSYIDEDSFFDGQYRLSPCGEPTRMGEVWRVVDGRVVATRADAGAENGALQLKESAGPRRFVLTLQVHGGGCDGGLRPRLYAWTGEAANRRLLALADDAPARRAFDQQCGDGVEPEVCLGLRPAEAPEDTPFAKDSPDALRSIGAFVARHGAEARERWLAAFLAGDTATLQASDVFPAWRVDALAALTASPLPLDQRRRRIAWMFRDAAGMSASFGSARAYDDWAEGETPVLVGLVGWLPREDWRPLLAAMGKDHAALDALQDAAQARGNARLACTLAQAAGKGCGAPTRR